MSYEIPGKQWRNDHHADKALIRCAQRMAIGGRCWHVPVSRPSAPAHATDLCLLSGHVRSRGLGLYTVDARANVGGSQEGRARHLGTAPMDCSCDALYGDTGLMALARSSMRRKFAGMTNVSTPRGAGSSVLWTSVTLGGGVRAAPRWELIGRRVCRRLSTVQIALNIADVSAPAAGQPVRRMAARRPGITCCQPA
jgi:hypothetical protein